MNNTVDNREGLNESSTTAAADGPPSFVFVTPKTKASSMMTTTSTSLWRHPTPSRQRRPQYHHLLADTPATKSTWPYLLDTASFDTDDDILQGLQDLADYQDEEEEDQADDGHGHHDHLNLNLLPPAPTLPAAPRIRHRWQPRHRRNSSDMSSIDMPDLFKAASDIRRGSYSTSATSLSSSIESSTKKQTSTTTTTTTTTTPGSNSSSSKTSPSSSNNINNKFKRMSLHQFVTANPQAILSVQVNTRLNW